jgi:hypothetical protein
MRSFKAAFLLTPLFLSSLLACTGSGGSNSSVSSQSSRVLVANNQMLDQAPTFISLDGGGLVGSIFIQPRNLMTVPDTQTVGCSQNGEGALGLSSYLSQPSWRGQAVAFTDVYVPMRNFLQGFPTNGESGGVYSVDSYFALDTYGNFHLDTTDVEGDYQFALIADDSAVLKIGNETTGAYDLTVDDQKPAGPNGACLEQTQPGHMSCTTNWSSQVAANVVTYHLKQGDTLPVELSYWQGPGQGLGIVLLYRQVPAAGSMDAQCGMENGYGNGQAGLTDVLTRWKPVKFTNLSVLLN